MSRKLGKRVARSELSPEELRERRLEDGDPMTLPDGRKVKIKSSMTLPDGRKVKIKESKRNLFDIPEREAKSDLKISWDYIGGYLDADGSITLHKGSSRKPGALESSQGVILIAQKIRWPLELIKDALGYGSIVTKKDSKGENVYEWRITKEEHVIDFLIHYLPLGLNKQKQGVLLGKYYLKRANKKQIVDNLRGTMKGKSKPEKARIQKLIYQEQKKFESWMQKAFSYMKELKKELD